jgi:hypothetical protein
LIRNLSPESPFSQERKGVLRSILKFHSMAQKSLFLNAAMLKITCRKESTSKQYSVGSSFEAKVLSSFDPNNCFKN